MSQDAAPTLQHVIKLEKEEDIKLEDNSQPSASLTNSSIKRESFRCGFCGEYFFYEKYLLEHIQEHHSKAPVTIATTRATIATTRVTIAPNVEAKDGANTVAGMCKQHKKLFGPRTETQMIL